MLLKFINYKLKLTACFFSKKRVSKNSPRIFIFGHFKNVQFLFYEK